MRRDESLREAARPFIACAGARARSCGVISVLGLVFLVLGPEPAVAAEDPCTALVRMSLPDTAISSATLITRASPMPEYCRVIGTIEQTITFEVGLPATTVWNGKFLFAGGGGFNGTIPSLMDGLVRGYAAAGSDTGHVGLYTETTKSRSHDGTWALNDPQAQINYAHRATHLVTVAAKAIVRAYYGREERRSYWLGCSNGGKMGLMEIQRYPEDFDGAIIGCFVIDRTRLMTSYTWNMQALAAAPIPPNKIPIIARATLAACDARDGLADGVIDSPDRCTFDPKTLMCKATDGPDCLTSGQVQALEKIYAGPRNSAGRLFPGMVPGHEEDYPSFITGSGTRNGHQSSTWEFQENFMRYFAFGPDFDTITQFDFDRSVAALEPLAKVQDAASPDLSAFEARGGKLIMYHGWADHSITALRTVEYYNSVQETHGAGTNDFVRLFLVPGLHHCTGGPGPWSFGGRGQERLKDDADHDIVAALDRWVEGGPAPETLIGAKFVNDDLRQGIAFTRPLCAYPKVARYTGSGDTNVAASFVCGDPR